MVDCDSMPINIYGKNIFSTDQKQLESHFRLGLTPFKIKNNDINSRSTVASCCKSI